MADETPDPSQRKLNLLQTIKAISWAFFGVRKGKGYAEDIAKLNASHVIIGGIIAAIIFVLLLVWVAHLAVSSAVG
ncbi:DUF2970 domain-containing protein [Candidimonas nitroreducens]|uniref:DUF2970 domain-containing protein n=1 Tax=Candidimonas nitroreducens TaxID=683354 RepID=A0A225MRG7_9BURK|nr:DUF2970 domain-containing protein [Candidimonas nitroreducens]OWT63884.1 hypothetical protein CEY11_06140 [Candidimonas nitroreducens]